MKISDHNTFKGTVKKVVTGTVDNACSTILISRQFNL